jgi:hypothetical protein
VQRIETALTRAGAEFDDEAELGVVSGRIPKPRWGNSDRVAAIRTVLEAGIEFIEDGSGPGVRLRTDEG